MRAKAHALIGKVVAGRYRAVQLLASGGIGDVFLAEPMTVTAGRDARARVAVKVLREEHRKSPDLCARFRREAEAAQRVKHANVISVIEPPTDDDGVLCFVTELLVGLDLADTLAYAGALAPARAARIALGVAQGLEAAHAAGVIHRDVKPENIFLVHASDGSEAVKIIDFGFACMSSDDPPSARVLGTPEYMAPEQARGREPSAAVDVYSLGVVLFEMVAGRATEKRSDIETLRERAPISEELEAVIVQATSREPTERFGSMRAMCAALRASPEALDCRRSRGD